MLTRMASRRVIRAFATSGPLDETELTFLPPSAFYKQLQERGFDFFAGVPDSLLKDITAYVTDKHPSQKHVITANEGTAIAVAAGYHMATRKFPVVYLQNSGIGNIINPLLSLVDHRVYKIPMLLLIGWRGEPGKKDEPQHMVQGKVMTSILTDIGCAYEVLPDYEEGASAALDLAYYHLKNRGAPYAFLVRRQTFLKYDLQEEAMLDRPLCREEAMELIIDKIGRFDPVVATTGFPSRELYELRLKKGHQIEQDFYCVGSMGHASSIAMGIALAKPSKQIYCFDGDGAFIMHMGAVVQVGARGLPNFKHILFNNASHDSVGGQPTVGGDIDMVQIARASGYKFSERAVTAEEVTQRFEQLKNAEGPAFLEIQLRRDTRKDLGRPKSSPIANKESFMSFIAK